MYLAPRCRLICPRCSRRRGVESVHLRFLYVSWVQIDVSQIGLFSERARKETPSAQYARKRAPPSTRSHPERPGPAGAGARGRGGAPPGRCSPLGCAVALALVAQSFLARAAGSAP